MGGILKKFWRMEKVSANLGDILKLTVRETQGIFGKIGKGFGNS